MKMALYTWQSLISRPMQERKEGMKEGRKQTSKQKKRKKSKKCI